MEKECADARSVLLSAVTIYWSLNT